MRRFTLRALTFAFMYLGLSTLALAQGGPLGTYCSANAYNGQWAFTYQRGAPGNSCAIVNNILISSGSGSGIRQWQQGYYRMSSNNVVTVDCVGFHRIFSGYGEAPLNAAFISARQLNTRFCLFHVNY